MTSKTRLGRWKEIIHIAWPLIIANSFWNLQMTIDRVFLSNYSTDALGAAMAVMGVFWTPMALLQQTAAYSVTFVAQYLGARRNDMIGPAVWQAIYISVIGGLLFLVFVPLSPVIFDLIGHSERMRPLESSYFAALSYSALPTALLAALSGFYTGLGQSRMVMWMNGVGLIANVILDYLLIAGNLGFPAMGIVGAGYATAGANWFAVAFAVWVSFSKKNEALYRMRSGWRYNADLLKRFLKFGVPSGLQWALEGLAFTVFLIFVGHMPNGDAALSASGIAVTLMLLAVLPAIGVGQAVSALVGKHVGEEKPELAEATTWSGCQVAAIYIIAVGITFLVIPEFYVNWFHNDENPEVWNQVAEMVPYILMFIALFTSFDSLNMVLSFALKGAGDTRFVTLVALSIPWPLMVLPTALTKHLDNAIYYAWGFASLFIICQAFVFVFRFRGGKWKEMKVI